MAEKHPLEELVAKRIKLTPDEASHLVFYLETINDLYEDLKSRYPKIAKDSVAFHSFIEVDYIDLGRALLWAETMVDYCDKIKMKATNGKNIIGDSKNYPFVTYSKEEGLREIGADGTIYNADPIELML